MTSVQSIDAHTPVLSLRYRCISALEVLLAATLVLGHNVWRTLPNEVWFLFALFWLSFKVRDGGWGVAGLARPMSWKVTLGVAVLAVLVLQVGSELIVEPLAHRIWPLPEHASSLLRDGIDARQALMTLVVVWTFAAFGEELGYRGYLLNRVADIGNRTPLAFVLALIISAVLFGFGHFYKGPGGVLDSTWSGLVLGAAFLLSGRNLWAPILAHGLSDTYAVLVTYMGWAN